MAGLDDPNLQFLPAPPLGVYDQAPAPWDMQQQAPAAPPGDIVAPELAPVDPTQGAAFGPPAPPVTDPQEVGAPQLDGAAPPPDLSVPPPATPDAGSGPTPYGSDLGAPAPFGPAQPSLANRGDLDVHLENHADQFGNNPWANPVDAERDAAARAMAISDPVGFAAYRQHLAEAKVAQAAADQNRIAQADLQATKDNIADRQRADVITQRKSDQIVADALKLSQTKVDRKRWFKDLGLGGQIATIGQALIGGLLQGANGTKTNSGIDWMMSMADKDIEDQRADLENGRAGIAVRQGAVAQEFARTGNLYQAAETVRLATRQAAISQLQTEQQNYDPRGTSFAAIGTGIQQMAANQAQVHEAQRKTIFDETLKVQDATSKALAQAEVARHNRAGGAIDWAKESRAKAAEHADNAILSPQEIHQRFPVLPIEAIPPGGATLKQLGQNTEVYNKTLETASKSQDLSPDERERKLSVPGVLLASGKPALFDDNDAKDARKAKGKADEIVRLTDSLITMVKEHGFESDFLKSKAWQEAQQTYTKILLSAKESDNLGALSQSDIDLVKKEIGSDDPTQFRNTIAGLMSFRRNTVEGLNTALRSAAHVPKGDKLARWEPPALDLSPRKKTADDLSLERLKSKEPDDALPADPGAFQAAQERWQALNRGENVDQLNVSPKQKADLAAIAKRAAAGSANDLLTLQGLASDEDASAGGTDSRGVRAMAKAALSQAQAELDADTARATGIAGEGP